MKHKKTEPPEDGTDRAARKISDQIIGFLFKKRFYHELLNRINRVYSKETGTIAADIQKDSISLYINPDYINSLEEREIGALLEHELLHICLLHPLRQSGHDSKIFDTASDIAVNQMISRLPGSPVVYESFFKDSDVKKFKQAEYYYKALSRSVENGKIDRKKLGPQDDHSLWQETKTTGGNEEIDKTEKRNSPLNYKEQKIIVSRIIKEAKKSSGGTLPSKQLEGLLEKLYGDRSYYFKKKWNMLLRGYLRKVIFQKSLKEVEIKPTKRRPNKKLGYPYPSLRVNLKPKSSAAVIIDSSGSITGGRFLKSLTGNDAGYLAYFESFLHELHCLCNKQITIHLLFADEQVLKPLDLETYDSEENSPQGKLAGKILRHAKMLEYKENGVLYNYSGKKQDHLFELLNLIIKLNETEDEFHLPGLAGGTSYVEAVKTASALEPDCIIYFTDSKDKQTLKKPKQPIIFVSTEKEQTPYEFAHYIHIEELTEEDEYYR